jgi:subtilisin family serine protease
MGRNVCTTEPLVAGLQPSYIFRLTQDQQEPVNSAQYAPQKLKLPEAHRLASGNKVLVAVIDSEVDANHPDLVGQQRAGNHVQYSQGARLGGRSGRTRRSSRPTRRAWY